MTRTFKIISLEREMPLIITQLGRPDFPTELDAGREVIMSIHDDSPAVVIAKQRLSDVEHPALGAYDHIAAVEPDGWSESALIALKMMTASKLLEVIVALSRPQSLSRVPDLDTRIAEILKREPADGQGGPENPDAGVGTTVLGQADVTDPNTVPPPAADGQGEGWERFSKRTKAELEAYLEGEDIAADLDKAGLLAIVKERDERYLAGLKKAELVDEAKRRGIEVDETATKGEIMDAITAAQ